VLLHHPTKLFLIPVISIRTTSVVPVMPLCDKLVPKRFHSQTRVLAVVRKRYSLDTTGDTPVRSANVNYSRPRVRRKREAVGVIAWLRRGAPMR
jgi:hypothetical protein